MAGPPLTVLQHVLGEPVPEAERLPAGLIAALVKVALQYILMLGKSRRVLINSCNHPSSVALNTADQGTQSGVYAIVSLIQLHWNIR